LHDKSAVPSVLILVAGTIKNQLDPAQKSMGGKLRYYQCPLLRNSWPRPTGVLEHCHKGETTCWSSIFMGLFFWPHP